MVRTYTRKTARACHERDRIQLAIEQVRDGMKVSVAARTFGIPRSTLRDKLSRRWNKADRAGAKTIFSKKQEQTLVDRAIYMADRGFPLTSKSLRSNAYLYAQKLSRRHCLQMRLPKNWTKSKEASYDWFLAFKARHPKLALRHPEGLSKARAEAFNRDRVENFFRDIQKIYQQLDLNNFPSLVYNCDETGLSSVPSKTSKVIALKGTRRVQKLTVGERGTLTTFVATVNAGGDSLPPFIIFKGKILPDVSKFPSGTTLKATLSGYIDHEIFLEFLKHFNDHRVKIQDKKCLLFLDGHKSHVTVEAVDFCIENNIELVCLPPHTTHRLQPLDTHYNKTLKQKWSEALSSYLLNGPSLSIQRDNFHLVFNKVWEEMSQKRGLVVDAFNHCGLYPVKNTVKDEEYKFSETFQTKNTERDYEIEDSHAQTLRNLMESPQKEPNAVHMKPHVAHISSPENVHALRQKDKLKGDKEKKKSNRLSKLRIRFSKPIDTPGTSTERHDREDSLAVSTCCVCMAVWSKSSEDWLRCIRCEGWACETCFGVKMCADCSD